jgi:hypothetical protein
MRPSSALAVLTCTLVLAGCGGGKHLRDAADRAADTAEKVGTVVQEAGKTMGDVTNQAVSKVNEARLLVSGIADTLEPSDLTSVARSGGQTFLVSGNEILALVDADVTLKGGLKVQKNGMVTLASGEVFTLKDKQLVSIDGSLFESPLVEQHIVEFRAMLSGGKNI